MGARHSNYCFVPLLFTPVGFAFPLLQATVNDRLSLLIVNRNRPLLAAVRCFRLPKTHELLAGSLPPM